MTDFVKFDFANIVDIRNVLPEEVIMAKGINQFKTE
jgi:hypothetical protein